jgi:hypothetical protein
MKRTFPSVVAAVVLIAALLTLAPKIRYAFAIATMRVPVEISACRAEILPGKERTVRYTVHARNLTDKAVNVAAVKLQASDSALAPRFVRFSGPLAAQASGDLLFTDPAESATRLAVGRPVPLECTLYQINYGDQSQWERPLPEAL